MHHARIAIVSADMELKMDDFDRLQAYTPLINIAHHIPGRIRLKLSVFSGNAHTKEVVDYLKRFGAAWSEIEGVHSAKLNLVAQSCTVEYDKSVIPFKAWPDLLAGVRTAEALVLLGILKRKYEELVHKQ